MSDYNGQDMRGSDAGQLSAIAMTAMVASVGNADSQARTESTVSDAVQWVARLFGRVVSSPSLRWFLYSNFEYSSARSFAHLIWRAKGINSSECASLQSCPESSRSDHRAGWEEGADYRSRVGLCDPAATYRSN